MTYAMKDILFPPPDAHSHPPTNIARPRPRHALASVSSGHPLYMPQDTPDYAPMQPFKFAPPAAPPSTDQNRVAGRPVARSLPARSCILGDAGDDALLPPPPPRPTKLDRLEPVDSKPTYRIGHTRQSAAKDLLYPGRRAVDAPPPPEPADVDRDDDDSPLGAPYEQLVAALPTLPRGADGQLEAGPVLGLLAHCGLHLSVDGFGELLARLDVQGVLSFDQFEACCARPHREEPLVNTAPDAVERAAEEAHGSEGEVGASVAAPPVPAAAPPPMPAVEPSEHHKKVMRHLEARSVAERVALPPPAQLSSMPLGSRPGFTPLGMTPPIVGGAARSSSELTRNALPDQFLV